MGWGRAGMEEVALQQGNKEMTEFIYLKMGEVGEGGSVCPAGTKARKQESTAIWDRVGMEGCFGPRWGTVRKEAGDGARTQFGTLG